MEINIDALDIPWKHLDFDGTEEERIEQGREMVTGRAAALADQTVGELRQWRHKALGTDDPDGQSKEQIIVSILEAEFSGPGGGRPFRSLADGSDPHRRRAPLGPIHVDSLAAIGACGCKVCQLRQAASSGDAVARAMDFLKVLGPRDRAQAALLLDHWTHRAELTADEFDRAIWAYPVEPRQDDRSGKTA